MKRRIPTYYLGPDFPTRLEAYTDRFLSDGYDYFSREFAKIDEYVAEAKAGHSKEGLRKTDKAIYLLELVAFKIYDELNREAFNRAKKTLIVMPDCFALDNKDCKKVETRYGTVCRRCEPQCQSYQVGDLARRYRVKTIFSKRKLTEQLQRYSRHMGDLGVIGIACIKMLAPGMRAAAEAGVPSRGVLLNFSGCEHWNDQPCASECTLTMLESILEEKHGRKNQNTDD